MFTFLENKSIKKLLVIGVVFFMAFAISGGFYYSFIKIYQDKFYPGIFIADISVGGKTLAEAEEMLTEKKGHVEKNGIIFSFNGDKTVITPTVSSFEIDLAQQAINFDLEKSLNLAIGYGRNGGFLKKVKETTGGFFLPKKFPAYFSLNENLISQNLKDKFGEFEIMAEDASLATSTAVLSEEGGQEISFFIREEKYGKVIDYENGLNKLKKQLARLDNSEINLSSKTDYPKIYKKDCLNIEIDAQKIISNSPLILKYEEKKWELDKNTIADLLSLESDEKKKINVVLGKEKLKKYLETEISPEINKEPINAKFDISDGRVTEFQAGSDGLRLSISSSTEIINKKFIMEGEKEINLVVEKTNNDIGINEVNNMGIEEIIGTGHSNFAGSPSNRRHNISVGSNSIKGLLIAPQEEFSLVKALGEIDAKAGYLPELVIKGNETIPEYGGGLCQVGTTLFRTALATGLEITARRNHSYRVSYYEPAGTDAAVYDPWPDVKFINDTGNYILIQTRMEGNDLYYDFWGTSDGRVATTTYPAIYNIVRPAPTKLIETLSLAPGEKKCTEHSHNGADAHFDYTINYANGEIKERRFYSHYVPWQEVCLVGVEKLSEDSSSNSEQDETESTQENSDQNDEEKNTDEKRVQENE